MIVSENTFPPMYSILNLFPQRIPLFIREYKAGLYPSALFYLSKIISMVSFLKKIYIFYLNSKLFFFYDEMLLFQLPGLIIEPFLFVTIVYWIVEMNPTTFSYLMSVLTAVLTLNVSIACGIFFSNAFESIELTMASLVPSDYVLMITSGLFLKLSTMSDVISWTKYLSWLMYAAETLSIVQWDGVQNISKLLKTKYNKLPKTIYQLST